MFRLVLDTDVIVAAMRSPKGASSALLKTAAHGQITMLASVTLAMEYQAVCTRAEHIMAAGLKANEAYEFVQAVIALIEPVTTYFLWRPQLNDANDEMVLEAAVNGRANALVTFNRRHFGTKTLDFGIETLTPAEIMRRIQL